MAAPVLNAYEYQYMDSGVLWNGSASLPFIDITDVTGLDIPKIDPVVTNYDNQHGGYISAQYVGTRTIILDANLYADPNNADVIVEQLVTNFLPRTTDAPLYYRGSGIAQRYIMCKPIGFNYNLNNLRNYGVTKIQGQLQAGDPTKYIDNAVQVMTSGTNYNVTNSGNTITYPVFTIVGAFTALTLTNNTTGAVVTITTTRVGGDTTIVDMRSKSVTINGVRNSAVATALGWWGISPGVTSYKATATGTPTSITATTASGWL